jgi:DNA repair exonuclease SbcCD nuclease subunit
LIITSDLHLRASVPRCRTETEEEWYNVQEEALAFLYSFGDPVLIAGDIFHHYNPGNKILDLFLSFALKHETYIMMGNHDARNGVLDPDSGYGVLTRIIDGGGTCLHHMWDHSACIPYGESEIRKGVIINEILSLHTLTFPSANSGPPGTKFVTARSLLDQYPDYGLIVTGDNHSHFLFEKGDRKVLNPGCLTKQSVIYKDKTLQCFRILISGELVELDLPDKGELVDDSYIVTEHEREDRYNKLVETLKIDGEMTFDFKDNVYSVLKDNHLGNETVDVIKELLPA